MQYCSVVVSSFFINFSPSHLRNLWRFDLHHWEKWKPTQAHFTVLSISYAFLPSIVEEVFIGPGVSLHLDFVPKDFLMIINFEQAIALTKEKFSFLVLFFLVSGKRNEKMKFYNLNEVWKTSAFWGGRALRCTWIELHINEDKRLRTRGIWIIFYVSD